MKIMGIDLGIKKIAYSIWEDGILTATEAYESRATDRHVQLMDIHDFIYEAAHHNKVALVVIEDTLIGNNRKYSIQLSQTMGAVLVSMGLLGTEQDLDVIKVNVATWKKDVVGNGHADKTAIKDYIYARDSAYAVLCGYDQDRFDAACIGYYGELIHHRAQALLAR